jgi:predicted small lipoprotein YifL
MRPAPTPSPAPRGIASSPCRSRATVLAGAVAALTIAACGSRGPLDFEVIAAAADASTDVVEVEAAAEASTDAARDARAEAGPTLLQCGSCITQKCGQSILQCIQSPACQKIFQCVTQKCFAGGTQDPSCIFECAAGDLKGASQVLAIFTCISAVCGPDCSSVLGGLGGGFPGGGGGGGGRGSDGGRRIVPGSGGGAPSDLPSPEERRHSLREVFSPWPELCAPSD